MNAAVYNRERGLLKQIGGLVNRVRDLRGADAVTNRVQITVLTGDLRTMWGELRALRAPPVIAGLSSRRRREHYD